MHYSGEWMPNTVLNGSKAPGRKTTRETPSIQSLDRGLLILETVGKSGSPVSLGHLASILGIDRSSAFRLANTLKRRGFLTNPSAGRDYILGPSVWRLSRQYDWSKMLATVARDHLKALAAATNETAHLAVREGRRALFIDHEASSHVIAIAGQTGELVPLYCTSHGKALISDFDEQSLKSLLGDKPLKSYTKNTIVTIRVLAKACEEIRARGFATDESEFLEGVRCLAAPIRDRDGAVLASIGISAPIARFPREREKEYAQQVTAAAAQIGEMIRSNEE
jgi:IclR family acetate operon transcriptional repressor